MVQILTDAGAIVLGKTNLRTELSAGYTTNNAFTGPTRNPYDTDRVPGGSSGGNSAALAARFAPLAIGEDTAGSTRIPAALTGTTGLDHPRDVIHRPASCRLRARSTPSAPWHGRQGSCADRRRYNWRSIELETVSLQGLRIGVPRAHFHDLLDPVVEQKFAEALARLERGGATLVAADLPGVGELSLQAFAVVAFFEAPVDLAAYLGENDTGVTLEELSSHDCQPGRRRAFSTRGFRPTEEQYLLVQNQVLPLLRQLYRDYFDGNDLDVMVYPSVPVPAPLSARRL